MIIQILFIATMFVCLMNLLGFAFKVAYPTVLWIDIDNVYVSFPCWIFQIWFWADRLVF